jgi:quinol monooxygenase YgiN
MVQLTVQMATSTGRAHELIEALRVLRRRSLRPGGCASVHISADVDQANAYWYCEDWESAEALDEELKSERFSQLLALMEASDGEPRLEIRLVSETRGLEYVSALRGVPAQ